MILIPGVIEKEDCLMMNINKEAVERFRGTNVLIVGLGETGISAVRLLSQLGCTITISESRPVYELKEVLDRINGLEFSLETGGHKEATFTDKDWILLSPGVSKCINPLVEANRAGITIYSDIELAYQITDLPVIAVTGTNGKTTTTTLLGEIIKNAGRRVFVGGNIGVPVLSAFYNNQSYELLVLEVSSFQLEGITSFAPYIGVVLNITPDHLDRYLNMEEYTEAKARLCRFQKGSDYAILNALDHRIMHLCSGIKSGIYLFNCRGPIQTGAGIRDAHIIISDRNGEIDLGPYADFGLKGSHNLENVMAASLAAYLYGIDKDIICSTLIKFKGLAHRMEHVCIKDQVEYIDDSKGTNVDAVLKAIETINTPIILIAGGLDKGGDFKPLIPLIREKVKLVLLIGQARSKIANTLNGSTKIVECPDLKTAVEKAYGSAYPGDTVLLSPGCASFDMFRDYKDRGEQFKRFVMEL